jgi:hypothetical protein
MKTKEENRRKSTSSSLNSSGPVVIGDQNVVTNSTSGQQEFYRLVH